MSRVLVNCAIFCLGIVLAFVFAFRGRLVSFAASGIHSPRAISISQLKLPSTKDELKADRFKTDRRRLLRRAHSVDAKISLIAEALDEGTYDALQLLRTDYLRTFPDYRIVLLPALKHVLLEALFKRFSDEDWRSWPWAAVNDQAPKTEARKFVDEVVSVNGELGRFLETAANLLHGMFSTISAGAPYSVREDLGYLLKNSAEVLQQRPASDVLSSDAFDPQILQDPMIVASLDNVRAQLVKLYVQEHPAEVAANLSLLLGLAAPICDAECGYMLEQLLRTLSAQASRDYRREYLPQIIESTLPGELSKRSQSFAKALAEFYATAASDAISFGSPDYGEMLLTESRKIFKGLELQDKVSDSLREIALEQEKQGQIQPSPLESLLSPEAAKSEDLTVSGGSAVSWWKIFAVFGLVALLIFGAKAFVAFVNRASEQQSLPPPQSPPAPGEVSVVTDPTSIQFDIEENEPDIVGDERLTANQR